MKWVRYLCLIAAALAVPNVRTSAGLVTESFVTGNYLREQCTGDDIGQAYCLGYVVAIADALSAPGNTGLDGWRACLRPKQTAGHLKEVVTQFLQNHPEKRDFAAVSLIAEAYAVQFPCAH